MLRLGMIFVAAMTLLAALLVQPAQTQTFTQLHSFSGQGDGAYPDAGLVMDRGGRFYGTTSAGGTRGGGTVFRLARSGQGWILTPLYSFQRGSDGATPLAGVVFGPDGLLYGTTNAGGGYGSGGSGTVFNLRPSPSTCHTALCPWTETVLYRFTGGTDGAFPSYADDLVFDTAGNLYGTTYGGGAYGYGVVFKLTPSGGTWNETVLWNFTGGNDGANPFSGVIFDSIGNLYGTTGFGGANGLGVIYELSPTQSGWTSKALYAFRGQDNGLPISGVIMDASGNLYGTTGGWQGGGEGYELSPQSDGTWIQSRRKIFNAYEGPFDTPTLDAAGNLYGTSILGGGDGEVFRLSPSETGWTYTSYYQFTGSNNNGYAPTGGVIFDAAGNLYGTTYAGGGAGLGTVWEITP